MTEQRARRDITGCESSRKGAHIFERKRAFPPKASACWRNLGRVGCVEARGSLGSWPTTTLTPSQKSIATQRRPRLNPTSSPRPIERADVPSGVLGSSLWP